MRTTRLAPSPTGALHLGNARSFLVNWLLARQRGWQILLRIEDLDGPRVKQGADQQAIEDLRWLGIDWDEGPIHQSSHAASYETAVAKLLSSQWAYACVCSRREADAAASAPHAEDGGSVYPGTCRGRFSSPAEAYAQTGKKPALRFAVPRGVVAFHDEFAGTLQYDVSRQLGDFIIAKADGSAAYQLAVVVDDAQAGVNDVVRGDDLLDSTPRQILLYEALGMARQIPRYYHLPLVVGADGRRLAKRHGDTRLSFYREAGVAPGRVLALLARWCGMNVPTAVHCAAGLLETFRLERLSREKIVFTTADDAWLWAGI
ncbi:MAG TPA: tRNA glutamyl-Q(34) synthetase GluQRS [Tepidisphaeraceae bacterium]|nr:tRNA glutamyl-Q(34) synthetase GluQRS [Tepidisphaeraceae bacterium]